MSVEIRERISHDVDDAGCSRDTLAQAGALDRLLREVSHLRQENDSLRWQLSQLRKGNDTK